jgi:hypothetical protein
MRTSVTRYYNDYETTENGMCGACNAHGKDEKYEYARNFSWEA